MFFEKKLSSKELYNGMIVRVHVDDVELPNGNKARREVVEHPGGVGIAALDSDGCILLVEQFRYPYGRSMMEVPAGKLEPGEDPRSCGIRELREETGAAAEVFEPMGAVYPSPGILNEIVYIYRAEKLSFGEMQPDEDEFLNLSRVPLDKAVEMVMDGTICDSKTVAAILKLQMLKNNPDLRECV